MGKEEAEAQISGNLQMTAIRSTKHRQRLVRYYGRIAGDLLHNSDFRKRLDQLNRTDDPQIRRALHNARTVIDHEPPPTVPLAARKVVAAIREDYGLPEDWNRFVWSAAVSEGACAVHPIAPGFCIGSLEQGPQRGLAIAWTARQASWWNSGALDYALKVFKRSMGSPTKPGRQPDYRRAAEAIEMHQRLGSWERVFRELPDDEISGDASSIRRQARRHQKRGYR